MWAKIKNSNQHIMKINAEESKASSSDDDDVSNMTTNATLSKLPKKNITKKIMSDSSGDESEIKKTYESSRTQDDDKNNHQTFVTKTKKKKKRTILQRASDSDSTDSENDTVIQKKSKLKKKGINKTKSSESPKINVNFETNPNRVDSSKKINDAESQKSNKSDSDSNCSAIKSQVSNKHDSDDSSVSQSQNSTKNNSKNSSIISGSQLSNKSTCSSSSVHRSQNSSRSNSRKSSINSGSQRSNKSDSDDSNGTIKRSQKSNASGSDSSSKTNKKSSSINSSSQRSNVSISQRSNKSDSDDSNGTIKRSQKSNASGSDSSSKTNKKSSSINSSSQRSNVSISQRSNKSDVESASTLRGSQSSLKGDSQDDPNMSIALSQYSDNLGSESNLDRELSKETSKDNKELVHSADSDGSDIIAISSKKKILKKRTKINKSRKIGSDSDESGNENRVKSVMNNENKMSSDSDSNSVNISIDGNDVKGKNEMGKSRRQVVRQNGSDSDGEEDAKKETYPTKSSPSPNIPDWKKSIQSSDLFDEDSSDEDRPDSGPEHRSASPIQPQKTNRKSMQKSIPKTKSKTTMSSKTAVTEMQKIKSESQRVLRQSHVDLPYHVPRQRTLAEFLQRRKPMPSNNKSLRMSASELQLHWKQIEEREKEAPLFYKSESSSEDENEKTSDAPKLLASSETKTTEESSPQIDIIVPSSSHSLTAVDLGLSSQDVTMTDVSVANNEALNTNDIQNKEIGIISTNCEENNSEVSPDSETLKTDADQTLRDPSVGLTLECNLESSLPNEKILPNVEKNVSDCRESEEIPAADVDEDSDDDSMILRLSDSDDSQSVPDKGESVKVNEDIAKENIGEIKVSTKDEEIVHGDKREMLQASENNVDGPRFPEGVLADRTNKDEPIASTVKKNIFGFNTTGSSSDSDDNVTDNKTPVQSDNKFEFGDKKLAMLRKRGLVKITNLCPRLSGGPGGAEDVIDLDEDVQSKESGVMELMQRFIKHSTTKRKQHAKNREIELSIVSAEKDVEGVEQVKKERVTMLLDEEEESRDPIPGAKLKRLKEVLQKQMAERRSNEWKRKLEERKQNEDLDDEKSECGILDDEAEMTASESEEDEEEEEEEEEDDMPLVETKRTKSAFVDEEADETGDEEDDDDDDEREEEEKDGETEQGEEVSQDGDSALDNTQSRGKFRRLKTLEMFDSDDDRENSIVEEWAENVTADASLVSADQSLTDCPAVQGMNSQYFLSPMNFNRQTKMTQESPVSTPPSPSPQPLSATGSDNRHGNIASTQEYLKGIMNGTSNKTKDFRSALDKLIARQDNVNTQTLDDDLMGLCSGKFPTQPIKVIDEDEDDVSASQVASQFPDTQFPDSQFPESQFPESQVANSQVADKQPQDSSQDAANKSQDASAEVASRSELADIEKRDEIKVKAISGSHEVKRKPWTQFELASSDDEGDLFTNDADFTKKKSLKKRLEFSDDEADEVASEADEVASEAEEADELVDYDSEENEVVAKQTKEFFDAEAELSESEWGSADEDEQGLDKLEYQEADAEQFDQEQMKEQLGKIHMRQVLDADKREVRMLQEMLFEDGELHGEGKGRERQFRWKNVDKDDDSSWVRHDSDGEAADDGEAEEDEERWRIMRHERETFLREQKEKDEAAGKLDSGVLEDEDSQLLKLGKAALRRIRSVHSQEQIVIERTRVNIRRSASDTILSPDAKRPRHPLVKRGSFLARGESALARIAEMTRGTTGNVVVNPKNSRNFVFATISPKEEAIEEPAQKVVKRKAARLTPSSLLKKPKVVDDKSKGRRLFDHLV